MDALRLGDLVFPGMVSILASYQIVTFAQRVSNVRNKVKLPFPQTTGNVAFERAFRAHQNSLEFIPVVMPSLWVSSIFFHPIPSSMVGLVYLYSRQKYFNGYSRSVEERLPGFKLGIKCIILLYGMSLLGMTTTLLRTYTNIDLSQLALEYIQKYLPSLK
ncbi:hypothetical protein LOTGIDRAFT_237360 [Lottia gigantea]|uniref:Microsomal glutathione S-transferase 2 n=1 Tax=Lottia gigantea TaxID=225164 RepID=V4BAB3_LOTGI|nr:hypothetical protein LOTGIDRAFT_237360 [Lottia gigantea]ESP04391.1 hypothetical protein LOTGIDRAFT_237360 [Lottia gigantea]